MQQIYRRTPVHFLALWHGCSAANLLHIFRAPFPKNTSGWLLLVALKYCCSFIQSSSKHFCIYYHLKFACFCNTPFGTCSSPCIKLYIVCSCLQFCLCLLTIHISFASLQYSALQYSFGMIIRFLVPFHMHIFCLTFFCQQPF